MAKSEQELHKELAELGMLPEEEQEQETEPQAGHVTQSLDRLAQAAEGEGDIELDEEVDSTADSEEETEEEQKLRAELSELLGLDNDQEEPQATGHMTQALQGLADAVEDDGDVELNEEDEQEELGVPESEPVVTPPVPEPEAVPEEPLTDEEQALHDELSEILELDQEADNTEETPTTPEPRSRNKLRELLGMLSDENRPRPIRAIRERLARENGVPFPSREDLPFGMPDFSGLLDFLPSRGNVPSARKIRRFYKEIGRPEPTDEEIQRIQGGIREAAENTEETTSRFKELTDKMKDVPWQTMMLTSAKPIAKVAATSVLRSTGKDLASVPLTQLVGASSVVNPIAAGIVAGVADSYRLATGGREKLYKSAAQDTWAGLTTWRAKERRGSESQAEFDKNRLKGKHLKGLSGLPLFALRKVGVAFNALRSANTQVWMGITRDRSKISNELARIDDGAETLSSDQLAQSILDKIEAGTLHKDVLLKLDRPLARLRAVDYGKLDVAGEKGKIWARVAERHTAERLHQLHEVLNQLINSGRIEVSEAEKRKWDSEYEDVERKRKDKARKFAIISGNALATFATVGAATWIPMLADKIEEFDLEDFKHRISEQFNSADDGELAEVIDVDQEVTEVDAATATPTPTASPAATATATPTQTATPSVTDAPSPTPEATAAAEVDMDTDLDPSDAAEAQIDTDTDLEVENGPDASEATESTADVGETAADVNTAEVAAPTTSEPQPFGLGEDRVEIQPETSPDVSVEASEDVSETAETVTDSQVVETDDVVEIQDLGDDELPWNAIYYSIQNNPAVNVNNINGTTNVIKNLYKALNNDLPTGSILPDSGFAILPDAEIPTELPEGAVAYFFSEDQIENLAEEIDTAINLSKEGAELTEMQEALVQLNGGRLSFEDLAQDKELLEDMLEIATER